MKQDFTVRRGNSYRMIGWIFPFDIAGDEIVLTISITSGGTIEKSTADDGLEVTIEEIDGADETVVYWTPTVAESRQIPQGWGANYELERRVTGGEQRTYCEGKVMGEGGISSD